mmetsp:Transcript_97599/g.281657  ORF Transcript_97599/g.281657 Transcript_97599/m.281657 type:complete len:245 (+) Transcript_97599:141-875(+)
MPQEPRLAPEQVDVAALQSEHFRLLRARRLIAVHELACIADADAHDGVPGVDRSLGFHRVLVDLHRAIERVEVRDAHVRDHALHERPQLSLLVRAPRQLAICPLDHFLVHVLEHLGQLRSGAIHVASLCRPLLRQAVPMHAQVHPIDVRGHLDAVELLGREAIVRNAEFPDCVDDPLLHIHRDEPGEVHKAVLQHNDVAVCAVAVSLNNFEHLRGPLCWPQVQRLWRWRPRRRAVMGHIRRGCP